MFVVICLSLCCGRKEGKKSGFRFPSILCTSDSDGKSCELTRYKRSCPLCFRQLGLRSFSHFWGETQLSQSPFPFLCPSKDGVQATGWRETHMSPRGSVLLREKSIITELFITICSVASAKCVSSVAVAGPTGLCCCFCFVFPT